MEFAKSAFDDIYRQACGGSIAAIVHILNQKLATRHVRTRAVIANRALQLLCEAPSADQLSRESTVAYVRSVLDALAPKGIRQVKLYARLVQEQQLLWLEEIQRSPEDLLWAESITLARSNWFTWLRREWQFQRDDIPLPPLESTPPKKKRDPHTTRLALWVMLGLVGGGSLLLIAAIALQQGGWKTKQPIAPNPTTTPPTTAAPAQPSPDAFARAVWLAEDAAIAGQTAKTATDWTGLADRWQRAAALMGEIPANDPRYQTAQNRQVTYQANAETARQKARSLAP